MYMRNAMIVAGRPRMQQNQLNAYLLGKHCLETGRRIAHSSTSGSSTSSRSTESLEDLDEYLDKVSGAWG